MTDIAEVYEELRLKGHVIEVGPKGCAYCGREPGRYHEYTCQHFAAKPQASSLKPQASRIPVYMMHPLGNGANREANRWLACQWQAAIQAAHPEWLVLAPWIGLSGAWSEELRDEGMAVDFATIDLCAAGVIAGPLDGPMSGRPVSHDGINGFHYEGVSPGMFDELTYFWQQHPEKPIHDLRKDFDIKLPANWLPKRVAPVADFRPRFQKFEQVYIENKPGGVCVIKDLEERAPGVYYYLIEHATTFWAHEQMIAPLKKT